MPSAEIFPALNTGAHYFEDINHRLHITVNLTLLLHFNVIRKPNELLLFDSPELSEP
jgi:hypothetical protein